MAEGGSWAREVAATVAGLVARHAKPGGLYHRTSPSAGTGTTTCTRRTARTRWRRRGPAAARQVRAIHVARSGQRHSGDNKYQSAPAFGGGCHASYLVTAWGGQLDAAAADLNKAERALSDAEHNTTAAKSALEGCTSRGAKSVAQVKLDGAQSAEKEARGNAAAAGEATKRFTVLLVSADRFGGAHLVGAGTVAADAMSTVGPSGFC